MVQISQPYMTTGKKKKALTIQTIFGKLMSLLFIILSRFVIAFLPKSKHLLIPLMHSSSASIDALSLLYSPTLMSILTTGKTIALTRWTFVDKILSLLFNMLSRFVIAFLPKSKHLLIPLMHSLSAEVLEPKNINSITVLIVSPSNCHEVV